MSNRTHIDSELQNIAPVLATTPVVMPYALPHEYFSQLAAEMLSIVRKEKEPLSTLSKTNPYTTPKGYFESLPQAILQKIHLLKISLESETHFWAQVSQILPYTVPNSYFESFPDAILQRIKEDKQSHTIPAGYFEALPDLLLAKVRNLETSKELEQVAPVLNSISKQPVQYVPAGYFTSFQPNISREQQSAPIAAIFTRKNRTWLKYAVAASITLMLSIGAYLFLANNNKIVPSIANQPTVNVINEELADLDATTIEAYLKTNNAIVQAALPAGGVEELSTGDLDELLQGFTDQQIEEHIEETPELPSVTRLKNHT